MGRSRCARWRDDAVAGQRRRLRRGPTSAREQRHRRTPRGATGAALSPGCSIGAANAPAAAQRHRGGDADDMRAPTPRARIGRGRSRRASGAAAARARAVAMLPGFDGHLLSRAFLEQRLLAGASDDAAGDCRARGCLPWRRSCDARSGLDSARAVRDGGAAAVRGARLRAAGAIDAYDRCAVADACVAATGRSALIVAPWGEPLDPLWRLGGHARPRDDASLVPALQRPAPAHRRRAPPLRAPIRSSSTSISRSTTRGRSRRSGVLSRAAALHGRGDDPRSLHALVAASDRHAAGVCRSLRDGVLAASAEILRALLGAPPTRTANRASAVDVDDALRTGADDRLPHPVPALRRSARRSCRCGIRSTAKATASKRCATPPSGRRGRRVSGTRCARSRGSRTPAAAPAICG